MARRGAVIGLMASRVAVFLHSGDYDRMHQALSIAAAAAASGRAVELFFFWWGLERLVQGRLGEPDLPEREDVMDAFERRGAPTAQQLLAHVRESGRATLYACSASLPLLSLPLPDVEKAVDQVVGWTRILQLTEGVVDRFYL